LKGVSLPDLAEAIQVGLHWIEDLTAEGAEDRRIAEVMDLLGPANVPSSNVTTSLALPSPSDLKRHHITGINPALHPQTSPHHWRQGRAGPQTSPHHWRNIRCRSSNVTTSLALIIKTDLKRHHITGRHVV
jgi:hypothetical protein